MTDDYTIEPPPERKREMTRDSKLDKILDILTTGDHPTPSGDGSAPEVSFEPDPEQLPTATGEEGDEEEEPSENGEGTANVAQPTNERKFRFPSARRHAVIER